MASQLTEFVELVVEPQRLDKPSGSASQLWLLLLTPFVILLHGSHPFADDAGIYLTGVLKIADPSLFQSDAEFILAHTHFSVFSYVVAYALRVTQLSVSWMLLLLHFLSAFLFLLGAQMLAKRKPLKRNSRQPPSIVSTFFVSLCYTGRKCTGTQLHSGVSPGRSGLWTILLAHICRLCRRNLWVEFIFPATLRQDSRYYTLGRDGIAKRLAYSFSRVAITRTDSGGETFNASEILGAGAAAGISGLYYPSQERTFTKMYQLWIANVAIDGGTFIFKEFWPNINNKFFHQND